MIRLLIDAPRQSLDCIGNYLEVHMGVCEGKRGTRVREGQWRRRALGMKVRFICKRREERRRRERRTEYRASTLWTERLIPNMEQIKCMTQNTRLWGRSLSWGTICLKRSRADTNTPTDFVSPRCYEHLLCTQTHNLSTGNIISRKTWIYKMIAFINRSQQHNNKANTGIGNKRMGMHTSE